MIECNVSHSKSEWLLSEDLKCLHEALFINSDYNDYLFKAYSKAARWELFNRCRASIAGIRVTRTR